MEEKRILGTVFDCELNFEAHFSAVEKACYAAFNSIKHLYTGKHKPSLKTGLILYKTLIRQIMDYSTVAIVNISEKQLKKMQSIQHKCLRLITQTLASSSREVLNLITNTKPIDLHFKLRGSESLARIMSKNSPVNESYETWKKTPLPRSSNKITTTYRKLELASQQILNKNINQHQLLKVNLHDKRFPPFVQKSSVLPIENSKELQKQKVIRLMMESEDYDYVIGTDGCTPKDDSDVLGPSAAAAVIQEGKHETPT